MTCTSSCSKLVRLSTRSVFESDEEAERRMVVSASLDVDNNQNLPTIETWFDPRYVQHALIPRARFRRSSRMCSRCCRMLSGHGSRCANRSPIRT